MKQKSQIKMEGRRVIGSLIKKIEITFYLTFKHSMPDTEPFLHFINRA
jgi:hypothetical protein